MDYLIIYNRLKTLEGFLNRKKRKQLQKLEQWLNMDPRMAVKA